MSDQTVDSGSRGPDGGMNRRSLLRAVGTGAAVVGGGGLLQACSSSMVEFLYCERCTLCEQMW